MNTISDYIIKKIEINYKIDDQALFKHGLFIYLSFFINSIFIFILAVLLNDIVNGLLFIILFPLIRIHSGGLHTSNYRTCFILTLTVFLFSNLYIRINFDSTYILVLTLLSSIFIVYYAPVQHVNNKLTFKNKYANRKKTTIIIIVYMILCSFLSYLDYTYYLSVSYIIIQDALFMFLQTKSKFYYRG